MRHGWARQQAVCVCVGARVCLPGWGRCGLGWAARRARQAGGWASRLRALRAERPGGQLACAQA
jgi:hypothetical protein